MQEEGKSVDEQIIEKIQEEVKRLPSLLNDEHADFQDKHTAMQTYLMSRTLEEIEGIHNGFYVLYNEKQKGG